jgi:radical SAM superfamily enzyme YgiQ (UPF0313 family)
MRTVGTVIIGSPDETEEDVLQTRDLLLSPEVDHGIACHLTPLPGTDVWDHAMQQGLVSEAPDWDYGKLEGWGFRREMVLTRHIPAERLEQLYHEMDDAANRRRYGEKFGTMRWRYLFDVRLARRIFTHWKSYARYLPRRRRAAS